MKSCISPVDQNAPPDRLGRISMPAQETPREVPHSHGVWDSYPLKTLTLSALHYCADPPPAPFYTLLQGRACFA